MYESTQLVSVKRNETIQKDPLDEWRNIEVNYLDGKMD